MKTTAVRKLLPEAWGFLCPVHTPDGAPCGLLNHLSHTCEIVNDLHDTSAVPGLLVSLGMSPVEWAGSYPPEWVPVILDGRVIGMCVCVCVSLFVSHYLSVSLSLCVCVCA